DCSSGSHVQRGRPKRLSSQAADRPRSRQSRHRDEAPSRRRPDRARLFFRPKPTARPVCRRNGPGMEIYTIGFTRRSASDFFGTLTSHGIRQLIDIRLHNSSQLAAFAKKDDLAFFLDTICGASYRHEVLLAPDEELLAAYRKRRISWETYTTGFKALIEE